MGFIEEDRVEDGFVGLVDDVAEVAEGVGVSGATASGVLADLERQGQVVRAAGGSGEPVRWSAVCGHASAKEGVVRLGRGELRQLVLDHVRRHPDEVSPAQLSKVLGHSAGAISNVLVKLAVGGEVVETSDRPRRYAARPR